MRSCGIDVGGTFSDFVVYDAETGEMSVLKVQSTPEDPSQAVFTGLSIVDQPESLDFIVHGTTVATNAILERKTACVGLVTTKGFSDVVEIGRQSREKIYSLTPSKVRPLVQRENRVEADERIDFMGRVQTPLTDKVIARIVAELDAMEELESVAICLLFSFFVPAHERRIAEAIAEKTSLSISMSSIVLPEFREYERMSTTVIDAAVSPIIRRYMSNLKQGMQQAVSGGRISIMNSNAGISSIEGVIAKPVETVLSGLAGGVLAASFSAEVTGYRDLVSLDIGGTSTDVALVKDASCALSNRNTLGGHPIAIQTVDVQTVGAGGGSIARFDEGFFRVGPESAGADPGPACYDQGGSLSTVTDANLITGRLNARNFAGGTLPLYVEKSEKAVEKLAAEMTMEPHEAALGILRVFENNVAAAIRTVSTERGHDPRRFALLVFGGAGPLHGCQLADLVGLERVIIPPSPGVWSAFGAITSDYRHDFSRSLVRPLAELDPALIEEHYQELEQMGTVALERDQFTGEKLTLLRSADVRYVGQSYELTVPWREGGLQHLGESFDKAHGAKFGFADPNEPKELVNIRIAAIGHVPSPSPPTLSARSTDLESLLIDTRSVLFDGEWLDTPVYPRWSIGSDVELNGPVILEQDDTTTFISPGWTATHQQATAHLIIERNSCHPFMTTPPPITEERRDDTHQTEVS